MNSASSFSAETSAYSAWVEVDLAALAHNMRQVVALVGAECRVMAVVKAEGYGHGAVEAARTFLEAGATSVAVSTVDEGLALRDAGLTEPILCFVPPLPPQVEPMVAHGLTVTLHQRSQLPGLIAAARRVGKQVRCQLKVDTGMGRLGVTVTEAVSVARELAAVPELDWEGVYTHFAGAQEPDPASMLEQWFWFRRLLRQLRDEGAEPPLRHCANSAALLRLPECRLNLVRPGTILYGDWPVPFLKDNQLKLVPAFRLCARVAAVRQVPAGTKVGYGHEWHAQRPTRLGILPVGYADGLSMQPMARTPTVGGVLVNAARQMTRARAGRYVLIGDQPAPIVGRIGMQLTTLDLTDLPEVRPGDVATVPCRKTAVPTRIPRVYQRPPP